MDESGAGAVNRCIIGDCCDVLPTLESGSVQCCVTSPPYDNLRTYGGIKPFTWQDFEIVARELYRVLCDGGVLCWVVGDSVVDGSETLTSAKQKIFFRELCGFRVHDTMIYEKANFSHPETVRYQQCFEYIFILSKGPPHTFNPLMDRVNKQAGQQGSFGANTKRERDGSLKPMKRHITAEFGSRTNIWRGLTAGQENVCQELEHPAMMPYWLARDLVQSWSNPGDTVLDPFAGSGTTGMAAQALGRQAILIEVNPDYEHLIRDRTAQQGLTLA